jgi:hypothetical protein
VSTPGQLIKQLSAWHDEWSDSLEVRQFQSKYRCCGWENAEDKGLVNCPMDYRSGCKHIIDRYIRLEFGEVFDITITCLVLGIVGWCGVMISFIGMNCPSDWFEMLVRASSSDLSSTSS